MDVSTGNGKIDVGGNITSSFPSTREYSSGSKVGLAATPTFGFVFDSWGGDISGTENPTSIVMSCDKDITASFKIYWLLVAPLIVSVLLIILLIVVLVRWYRQRAKATANPVE